MFPRCPRCAALLEHEPDLPCWMCWEARATASFAEGIVRRVEEGSRRARQLLGAIGDRDALPVLRRAVGHPDPVGRAAGNALVVQPGGHCQLETVALATGPQLFAFVHQTHLFRRQVRHRPYERFIRVEEGADPVRWEWPERGEYRSAPADSWNKLGGTPHFLQGEQYPPGDGWMFAFQFSAGWAGRELGDGAECYGFVREDGTGAFLWQCH